MEHSEKPEFFFLSLLNVHLPWLNAHESLIVLSTWLVMAIIVTLLIITICGLKKIPAGLQNTFELLTTFIEDYITDVMGERGRPYFPLVMTVLLFVAFASYIGLIPGLLAPTAFLSTTAAIAIVVFVFYQAVGIRRHGIRYFKRFFGPIPAMAPFMFFMEIISEFARPLSLSIRLFANMMGGEMIIKMLFGAIAVGLPVVWMLWDSLITIPIQSFIFSLLTMIYLGGALASDEEH